MNKQYTKHNNEKTPNPSWMECVSTYSFYEKKPLTNQMVAEWMEEDFVELDRVPYTRKTNTGKPTILLLTWEYPPHLIGGLAKHVQGLAKGLHKIGCQVCVITANPGHLLDEELADGVLIYRVKTQVDNSKNFLQWIQSLNKEIVQKALELSDKLHFTIIHAHDWLVEASGNVLKMKLQVPLIATIHATEHGRNNGIHTELQKKIHEKEQQLLLASNNVIVCSEYMKEEIDQIFTLDEKTISIIPNGVEEAYLGDREALAFIPLLSNKRFIFSIGRMVKEKGFDTLIEAAKYMKTIFPDVYFIIAGKGPMLDDYRNKVMEFNLQDHVFLIGFVNEEVKNALYKECTIAVFPSRYEPFGIVALEAMALGKPTIVSNTGGLKGIVQHNETGLLMEPGNVESFIEQATFFLENELAAQGIAHHGKRMVESTFCWQEIAKETKEIYDQAIYQSNKDNLAEVK